MFSIGAFVLALTAAAHLTNAADTTALVNKLNGLTTELERIKALGNEDFLFDFEAHATAGGGTSLASADISDFPALYNTELAMLNAVIAPCSVVNPHIHRASEMLLSVNSTIDAGFIIEDGSRVVQDVLTPGSAFLIPRTLIHYQVNNGCAPASTVSTFDSKDPGLSSAALNLLQLPGAVLEALGLSSEDLGHLNVAKGATTPISECIARCGLGGSSASETSATQMLATASPTPTSKVTPPGKGMDHLIRVGLDGLVYSPSNITAAAGDTVTFEFHAKNHTVTQSSFDDPCHALTVKGVATGFKSGFVPVPPSQTANFPTFQITINDTTHPIWGYCGQPGPPPHCEQGMVFSINADESGPKNFAAFLAKAKSGAFSASVNTQTSTQTSASTSKATSSPSKGTDHLILVGKDGLVYTPSNITAAAGDTVTFEFHQKNHTVTQSSFENPCHARTYKGVADGFKSGFVPVPPSQTADFPTFQITINNTQPIWGYCGQLGPPPHCEQGMVFSINADESGPKNFAAFLAKAKSGASSASVNTQTSTQTSSASTSKATSSPGKGTNHLILVGKDGLVYTPSNITAAAGDTVTFEFHQKNHTVTQSSFADPCKALTMNGVPDGFNVPVPPSQTANFPTFQIQINDTKPIWGYCGQLGPPPHCEQGMVFSINANETGPNNFAAFLANAKYGASSASAAPSASGSAAGEFLAADLASNSGGTSSEPSPTLIALIAIIGVLVVGIIVIAVMYFRKRRAGAHGASHRPLYTGLGTAEPVFVAREKSDEKSDEEEESHGLAHGPYYDPHESR